MKTKTRQAAYYKEATKAKRLRKAKEKKALVIARQKGLRLLPDVPQSFPELLQRVSSHGDLSIHIVTWFRHHCTDYDEVILSIHVRLDGGYSGYMASAHLKDISYGMLMEYLRNLECTSLLTYPNLLAIKKDLCTPQ